MEPQVCDRDFASPLPPPRGATRIHGAMDIDFGSKYDSELMAYPHPWSYSLGAGSSRTMGSRLV